MAIRKSRAPMSTTILTHPRVSVRPGPRSRRWLDTGAGAWGRSPFCPSRGGPGCFDVHPFGHGSSDQIIRSETRLQPSARASRRAKRDKQVPISRAGPAEGRRLDCIDRDETEGQKRNGKGVQAKGSRRRPRASKNSPGSVVSGVSVMSTPSGKPFDPFDLSPYAPKRRASRARPADGRA